MQYSFSTGISSGTTYTFKFRSQNSIDYSPFSEEVRFAAATPPAKPSAPTKNSELSYKDAIYVEWSASSATEILIAGYRLYMSRSTGVYTMIYNGDLNPLQRSYLVTNLTTGEQYQFQVSAVNFNGESALSNALVVYSCIAPSQPSLPVRTGGTSTLINLQWTPPTDDGGCPLTGYKLMRNSGGSTSITI